jgi:hypothetical protein
MAYVNSLLQFDDESFALELQLEEIEAHRELQSGKWTEDSPPDFALVFNHFEAERNCEAGFESPPVIAESTKWITPLLAMSIQKLVPVSLRKKGLPSLSHR